LSTAFRVSLWVQAFAGPSKCKRWSFRSSDGVCRLFGPPAVGVVPLAVSYASNDDRAWYSGEGVP
jgi:hypothetical protein